MSAEFKIFLFSPDGPFTAEEVQELVELGIRWKGEKEGLYYRLSPITAEEINGNMPESQKLNFSGIL